MSTWGRGWARAPRGGRPGAVLTRLHVGAVGSQAGEQLAAVALAVYAYRAGGAAAVGLVAMAQMLPAAVLGPFAAVLGDRYLRERVVIACDLVRSAATAGAAGVSGRTTVRLAPQPTVQAWRRRLPPPGGRWSVRGGVGPGQG